MRPAPLLAALSLVLLAACSGGPTQLHDTPMNPSGVAPTPNPTDALQARGQEVYTLVCAHCHGYNMEGQVAESREATLALGMNLVPSLGAHGHAWLHPDQLLTRVLEEGIQNPLDQYPMPAFAGELSELEIRAVIAYVKMWWTAEQRAHQARLTADWDARTSSLGLSD